MSPKQEPKPINRFVEVDSDVPPVALEMEIQILNKDGYRFVAVVEVPARAKRLVIGELVKDCCQSIE